MRRSIGHLAGVGSVSLAIAGCPAIEDSPCAEQPGFICALAGTGELGFNKDGLPALESDLFLVSAARRRPGGDVYVMDFNNHRLRMIDQSGIMHTRAGNGFHALADLSGAALDSPLENPIDFDFFADGRVVFVSYHDPRVLVLDGPHLRLVAGSGEIGTIGDEGDGGPAEAASFMQLDGIAITPGDTIYVSDSLANRVRMIRDGIVTTVAGNGVKGYGGDDGPATAAMLSWPTALVLDEGGNLYIADTFNHAVRRLATDGTITTVAGTGVQGFAGDGGPALASRLDQPYGVGLGDDASLYIADRGNFRIRRVSNGTIDTVAGTGMRGATGDGGHASEAQLAYVARIAFDGDGLLVADQSNSRVRRINLE